MKGLALVFLGAGLGGVVRYGVSFLCLRSLGPGFPWGTLGVNVVGSFLMGGLAAWLSLRASDAWREPTRLLLATGVLGGFTTFSAFSLDTLVLWEKGDLSLAAAYIAASVALSIIGLAAGLAIVRGALA
jgi:CrcB protein